MKLYEYWDVTWRPGRPSPYIRADRRINGPTDGHAWLQRCEDASKNTVWSLYLVKTSKKKVSIIMNVLQVLSVIYFHCSTFNFTKLCTFLHNAETIWARATSQIKDNSKLFLTVIYFLGSGSKGGNVLRTRGNFRTPVYMSVHPSVRLSELVIHLFLILACLKTSNSKRPFKSLLQNQSHREFLACGWEKTKLARIGTVGLLGHIIVPA